MDSKENGKKLLAASIAGFLAVTGAVSIVPAAHAESVHCYGINACKGKGDCGGKGRSCAGSNACKGQGYLDLAKETCLKIQGGSLTPSN